MSEANQLRVIIAVIGALLLLAIWWFGTRKPRTQGRRTGQLRSEVHAPTAERVEPTLGDNDATTSAAGHDDIDRLGAALGRERAREDAFGVGEGAATTDPSDPTQPRNAGAGATTSGRMPARSALGARPNEKFDRIITLHVVARTGELISGAEWVVAAEKIGLIYGHMDIFHRLVEGRPEAGPIFSVANRVKPGHFDLASINELRFPGLTFFMTLPGPLSALDAWDTMLPAAQRAAELLDAQLLDENHNALGRQTIQHLRDDLRAYDRARERNTIKRPW